MKVRPYLGEVVKDAAGSKYVIIAFDESDKMICVWRLNTRTAILGWFLRSWIGQWVSDQLKTTERTTVATISNIYPLEAELS